MTLEQVDRTRGGAWGRYGRVYVSSLSQPRFLDKTALALLLLGCSATIDGAEEFVEAQAGARGDLPAGWTMVSSELETVYVADLGGQALRMLALDDGAELLLADAGRPVGALVGVPGLPPERCDPQDHDCDGDPHNGFSWEQTAVGVDCDGVGDCGGGVVECLPDGLAATCSSNPDGTASQAVDEVCGGGDEDCDDAVDEPGPATVGHLVEVRPPGSGATSPRVAWANDRLSVVWQEDVGGVQQVRAAVFASNGDRLSADIDVTDGEDSAFTPAAEFSYAQLRVGLTRSTPPAPRGHGIMPRHPLERRGNGIRPPAVAVESAAAAALEARNTTTGASRRRGDDAMTLEIALLLALLVGMAVLFFTELLPIEVTAFLGLVILTLGGSLTPAEAFTGFASPAVITMLSVFFVGAALLHTGVADRIGAKVHRLLGDREVVLIAATMIVAGVMSAFMNNIAAVAVLLPAVASIARKTGVAPSRLFMPLSYGAILGGTMTLVGTPPNILAAELLGARGLEPFSLFDFTPLGAVLLGCGTLYMVTVGRWLLPKRAISGPSDGPETLAGVYQLHESLFSIRIPSGSPLDGGTLGESGLGRTLDVQVVGTVRNGRRELAPRADAALHAGDVLLVKGRYERVEELFRVQGVEVLAPETDDLPVVWDPIGCVLARLTPGSALAGQTLRDLRFRERFGAVVVGVRRDGELLDGDLAAEPLREGDELVAFGTRDRLDGWSADEGLETEPSDPGGIPDLRHRLTLLRVHAGSALAGTSLAESHLGELVGLTVAGIVRGDQTLAVGPARRVRAGDRLVVAGSPERIRELVALGDVQLSPDITGAPVESDEIGIVEVTLAPRSRAAGRTPAELDFRATWGLQVLSIWRRGAPLEGHLAREALRLGDALLVQGPWDRIRRLGADPDFVVLSSSAQEARRIRKAPAAVAGLALMIGMVASGYMPIHVAAFTAATFVVLLGAITMEEAYRAVEWKAVFLVAAILPVGVAMERSGAAALLSDTVVSVVGPFGATASLAGLASLSSLLSQCLDGAPAVVLMAPVVLQSAAQLGLGDHAAMMAVSLAASAAFMTPFSHKANLLVMGSGGYRVTDYLRVGTPLTLVLLALVVLLVPLLFPGTG